MDLVRTAFRDGTLLTDCTWKMVVLPPKVKVDYRGIGLIKVLYKTVLGLIKFQIGAYVTYYDTFHGFRAGRGTGTASLEAKLLQQLTAMREEVLYEVFLDLEKAYEALN